MCYAYRNHASKERQHMNQYKYCTLRKVDIVHERYRKLNHSSMKWTPSKENMREAVQVEV
jgi:hypothetical protein